MSMPGVPLDETTRSLIERAADGFVPIGPWISEKVARRAYEPAGDAPWRRGDRLCARALQVGAFFDALLRESSGDADLKARWDGFQRAPLARCPIVDVAAWRANRGLAAEPQFAVTISDAVLADANTREISRAEFYLPYWSLLSAAYRDADAVASDRGERLDEQGFAQELLVDVNQHWPKRASHRASRFAKQFVKDVLYCYLGLRGLAEKPWSEAVLAELGEGRRRGNKYGSEDAVAAVQNLKSVIERTGSEKAAHPGAEPGRHFFAQPIGSPPVNARDL